MNLYLLKPNNTRGYDITKAFVIAAKNAAEARSVAFKACHSEHYIEESKETLRDCERTADEWLSMGKTLLVSCVKQPKLRIVLRMRAETLLINSIWKRYWPF